MKKIYTIEKKSHFEKEKNFLLFQGPLGKTKLHPNRSDALGNKFFKKDKNSSKINYTNLNAFISNYTPFTQKKSFNGKFQSLYKKKQSIKSHYYKENTTIPFYNKEPLFDFKRNEKRIPKNTKGSIHWISQKMLGCTLGYVLFLKLIGLGYKFSLYPSKQHKDTIILSIKAGHSHKVKFYIPKTIQIFLFPRNRLALFSTEQEIVANLGYAIRKVRPPTPYKGKGIRFENEIVVLKEGKVTK